LLVVSNLGPSGLDGVSIDVRGSDGFDVHCQPAPGAVVLEEVRGLLNGAETLVARTALTRVGSNLAVLVNFPAASNALKTVGLYVCNNLVARFTNVSESMVAQMAEAAVPEGVSLTASAPVPPSVVPFAPGVVPLSPEVRVCIRKPRPGWPGPDPCIPAGHVPIAVAGYGVVVADEIRVRPLPCPPLCPEAKFGGLTTVALRGSNVGTLVIDAEATRVTYAGHEHVQLGDANLTVQSNRLAVWNLGSSGRDGVRINVAGSDGFELQMQCEGTPQPEPPDIVLVDARGWLGNVEQALSIAQLKRLDTNLALTVSFPVASNAFQTLELCVVCQQPAGGDILQPAGQHRVSEAVCRPSPLPHATGTVRNSN
jgi:hypothetical protein